MATVRFFDSAYEWLCAQKRRLIKTTSWVNKQILNQKKGISSCDKRSKSDLSRESYSSNRSKQSVLLKRSKGKMYIHKQVANAYINRAFSNLNWLIINTIKCKN